MERIRAEYDCDFCGHSEAVQAPEVRQWLNDTIQKLCFYGAKRFLMGGYGMFDGIAASAVWQAKTTFTGISSVLVLPYVDRKADMTFYDYSLYPPLENVPRRYAIAKRNQWMVDAADVVVAYVMHDWGGAAKTYQYALRQGKTIINYADTRI